MSGAREQTLRANGLDHFVLLWGEAPVDVLLCHGFLDVAYSFDAVARGLVTAGHGVASFDWRGHGKTQWIGAGGYYHFPDYVLDLDELLPQLTKEPVHLVGHSMGGTACAMFAAARPEKLRSLSLIEGLGPPDQSQTDLAARLRSWLNGVQKRRNEQPRTMPDLEAVLTRMRVQNPELPTELGSFLASKSTRVLPDGSLRWSFDPMHRSPSPRRFSASDFCELLETIEVPCLAVAAEQGYRLQDEALRLSKIPKLRFAEIGEVGHMIHWHRPEALARELLEFFAHSAA